MTKIGVGVGDDFPLDDGNGESGAGARNSRSDEEEFEAWKHRRAEWRARREEWRRQREEWRARKRAFKARVREAARESFGGDWDDYATRRAYDFGYRRRFPFFFWPLFGLLIPILAIALVISLIAAVFQSPFLFLGLAALAFVFFGWRHNRRRYGGACEDYDFDLKPASGSSPSAPPAENDTVVTPPPPAQNGGTS